MGKNSSEHSAITTFLVICALCSIAIAQPLFTVLGDAAPFFSAHALGRLEIFAFAICVSIFIPVAIFVCGQLLRKINHFLGDVFFIVVTILLCFAFVLTVLNQTWEMDPYATIGLSLIAGAAIALLLQLNQAARSIVSILSVGVIVFPVLFLFFGPVAEIVFAKEIAPEPLDIPVNSDAPKTPVVLVIFDEFTPLALLDANNQIDSVRFPNISAFINEATLFPNASSVHVATTRAVPAILTGMFPPAKGGLPTYTAFPNNIFTLLGGKYKLHVMETFTSLCPRTFCESADGNFDFRVLPFFRDVIVVYKHLIYPKAFADEYLPALDDNWYGFGAESDGSENFEDLALQDKRSDFRRDRIGKFRQFIEQIEVGDSSLDFIHAILPHTPLTYLPDGRRYNFRKSGAIWRDKALAEGAYHRYLMQVGLVDMLIGELIAHLKKIGKYDDALVILTADHGVNFGAVDLHKRGISETNAISLYIPMIIKMPKQKEAKINNDFVLNIDVLPTISDVLGVNIPWEVDGVSILDENGPRRESITVSHKGTFFPDMNMIVNYDGIPDRIENFGQYTPLETLSVGMKYTELVGRRLEEVDVELNEIDGESPVLKLPLKEAFRHVDMEGELPALLFGQFKGAKELGSRFKIAVTLNEKIVGITDSTLRKNSEQDHTFSLLIPPAYFREGRNDVRVFRYDRDQSNNDQFTEFRIK